MSVIGDTRQIGDIASPSSSARVEWLLNQIREGLGGPSAGSDYTAILAQIYAAVDGLELSIQNIDLSNAQINLNTDQLEALIANVKAVLDSIKLDTAPVNLNLLAIQNTIANKADSIVSFIDEIETLMGSGYAGGPPHLEWIRQITQDIFVQINVIISILSKTFDQPMERLQLSINDILNGNNYNYDSLTAASNYSYQLGFQTITNITGDGSSTNFADTAAWIFGKYRYFNDGLSPNNPPDRTDYDFVVKPGETLKLDSRWGFWLAAEGGPSASGSFVIRSFGEPI